MTDRTVIPAGHRLTIKSWEKDGDNSNTVVLEGLTEPETRYLVDICKLFEYSRDYDNRLCNMYEPPKHEIERIKDAFNKVTEKHGPGFDRGESMRDTLFGLGLSSEEFYTRVCKTFKVEYIETPIVLKNVTEEFT